MNKYLNPKKYSKRLSIVFCSVFNRIFGRVNPLSRRFGLDRGLPIDRYYIEKFLEANRDKITGTVVEIGDDRYTKKFGTNVTKSEVLNTGKDQPMTTIIGDLSNPDSLPGEVADCIICTQTFNFIYDVPAAMDGAIKMLKPGGVLLATVAGISQISRHDMDRWGDYWRFTTLSLRLLSEKTFGKDQVKVESYGNCLAAKSFLDGQSATEIPKYKLDKTDNDYQMLITLAAFKKQ